MCLNYVYHDNIWQSMNDGIFVFGSNLSGIHGAGAAKFALSKCGAIYGQGIGLQGYSYALPTKNKHIITLPIKEINIHIQNFIRYASLHADQIFFITQIGCGYAGYIASEIAPLFKGAPCNCHFPKQWKLWLE